MKPTHTLLAAALFLPLACGAFELRSPDLAANQSIPAAYYWNSFGCNGDNQSPALYWKDAPAGTRSFAVTFYDPDAPTGSGFWHYVAYDLPASTRHLDTGALAAAALPPGAREGNTDLGKPGFFGPCPPLGRQHHYVWTVHALSIDKLSVPEGASAAMTGFFLWQHTLDKATLTVTAGPR
ncbi:MAG: YbhB/YbcL family Raf kinase inhibitor-like protein [Rhodocyclaceae bacterium]